MKFMLLNRKRTFFFVLRLLYDLDSMDQDCKEMSEVKIKKDFPWKRDGNSIIKETSDIYQRQRTIGKTNSTEDYG